MRELLVDPRRLSRISLTLMRARVRMGSIRLPAQESRNVELVLFWVRRGLPAKGIERPARWRSAYSDTGATGALAAAAGIVPLVLCSALKERARTPAPLQGAQ